MLLSCDFDRGYNNSDIIGLHHPLDGVTNPEYNLLCFIQVTKVFCIEKKPLAFNRDMCCHLALSLWLILFHYIKKFYNIGPCSQVLDEGESDWLMNHTKLIMAVKKFMDRQLVRWKTFLFFQDFFGTFSSRYRRDSAGSSPTRLERFASGRRNFEN